MNVRQIKKQLDFKSRFMVWFLAVLASIRKLPPLYFYFSGQFLKIAAIEKKGNEISVIELKNIELAPDIYDCRAGVFLDIEKAISLFKKESGNLKKIFARRIVVIFSEESVFSKLVAVNSENEAEIKQKIKESCPIKKVII